MMVPKTYEALDAALEEGCAHGVRKVLEALEDRALIRDEIPDDVRASLASRVRDEVMLAIHARFRFEEPDEQ